MNAPESKWWERDESTSISRRWLYCGGKLGGRQLAVQHAFDLAKSS